MVPIDDIYRGHHTASSAAEASALAVKAGTDLDCGRTYRTLPEAVRGGLISEKQIDESVQRLFVARYSAWNVRSSGTRAFLQHLR